MQGAALTSPAAVQGTSGDHAVVLCLALLAATSALEIAWLKQVETGATKGYLTKKRGER